MVRSTLRIAGLVAVAAASALALAGCPGRPVAGEACAAESGYACDGEDALFACHEGRWASVPCEGPTGCTGTGSSLQCDTSVATAGALCPPWKGGRVVCRSTPSAVLECREGRWAIASLCGACAVRDGTAQCTEPAGCGPDTCDGCCQDGGCVLPPHSEALVQCGKGGLTCDDCGAKGEVCGADTACHPPTTGCSPATCAGCCSGGACIPPPANGAAATCGAAGALCQDCAAMGLVCRASVGICDLPTGVDGGSPGTDGGTSTGCAGVPTTGRCLTATAVQYCAVLTGSSTPSVQTYTCAAGSTCTTSSSGARCVSTGACAQGQSRCQGPTTLEACDANGSWTSTPCATGCRDSVIGGYCPATGSTRTLEGRLLYMTREPNAARPTDWAAATAAPGGGVAVLSQLGDGGWLDVTTTNADGGFAVRVAASPTAGDGVYFAAFGGDGLDVTFALIKPNLAAGTYTPFQSVGRPEYWIWSRTAASLVAAGSPTVTIAESEGSAALNLYDVLHRAYVHNHEIHHGTFGAKVALWFQLGVAWTCGACFGEAQGYGFDSHAFFSGDSASRSYWSDPVAAHELGHWAMSSWGTNPGEGGPHYLGVPTFPGMAWSEGWATFHGSKLLGSPVYFDRNASGMFWVDLSTRTSTDGALPQSSATADGGLQQRIDENEVASMLWELTSREPLYLRQVHNALSSPHMRQSPWPRGYLRREWSVNASTGEPYDVEVTSDPASFFADFLDALVCQGVPPAAIDGVTAPTVRFPYPSSAPLCQRGTHCYGCLSGATCQPGDSASACGTGAAPCTACLAGQTCRQGACRPKPLVPLDVRWLEDERTPGHARLRLRIERRAALPLDLHVRLEAPDGTELEAWGARRVRLPPSTGPSVHVEPVTVRFARTPGAGRNLTAIVEGANGRMGFSGAVPYRFGRRGEEPVEAPVPAAGPELLRHGKPLGPSVLVPDHSVAGGSGGEGADGTRPEPARPPGRLAE